MIKKVVSHHVMKFLEQIMPFSKGVLVTVFNSCEA